MTNTENATSKTPGFNCRLAIWFDTDRNGRKVAYYWGKSGRAIRLPLADAEMFAATETATVIDGHPLRPAAK